MDCHVLLTPCRFSDCNARRALVSDGRLIAVVLDAADVPSRPCDAGSGNRQCLQVELQGSTYGATCAWVPALECCNRFNCDRVAVNAVTLSPLAHSSTPQLRGVATHTQSTHSSTRSGMFRASNVLLLETFPLSNARRRRVCLRCFSAPSMPRFRNVKCTTADHVGRWMSLDIIGNVCRPPICTGPTKTTIHDYDWVRHLARASLACPPTETSSDLSLRVLRTGCGCRTIVIHKISVCCSTPPSPTVFVRTVTRHGTGCGCRTTATTTSTTKRSCTGARLRPRPTGL